MKIELKMNLNDIPQSRKSLDELNRAFQEALDNSPLRVKLIRYLVTSIVRKIV